MAHERKSKIEQNAYQIAQWLIDNRKEFEQEGITEARVATAVGLLSVDAKEAVDHLENREEVVRMPQPQTTPRQFVLKPGRIWADIREQILEKRTSSQE
jgi:hypothetical protein